MGVELILIAALCASVSNYFMRRSIDAQGTAAVFLVIQLLISLIVAIVLNPVRLEDFHWSNPMAAFGFIAGLILGFMMRALGRALQTGPPGLTFAMVNSASVMPCLLLFLAFGAKYGCDYNLLHAIGSLCVIAGFFWAGWQTDHIPGKKKWLLFALAAFALHMTGLAIMQWRALFINYPEATGLLLNFSMEDVKSQWFLPMLFLAAFLVQAIKMLHTHRRLPQRLEVVCGLFGGIANGAATFFLMLATEYASEFQRAMLFPVFAVGIIILCNGWGHYLYKEKVNWWANLLCVAGIIIATVDWSFFL